MRSRTALTTLISLLALAAPAAAQSSDPPSLEAAYEYAGSVLPAFHEPSSTGKGFGPATFAPDVEVADGVVRTVSTFAAGEPYRYDAGMMQSEWAVSMLFRLDDVSGRRRILNVQKPGDANALYVEDGRLVYELGASDATGAAGRVVAGEFVHVVALRRWNDDVRVFVDGTLDVSFSDTGNAAIFESYGDTGFPGMNYRLRLFDGAGGEAASGQLARLRTFEDELSDAAAAGLHALDVSPAEVTFPSETAVDGAFWANRGDAFSAEIVDEGSSARVESWLEDVAGVEVAGTRAERPLDPTDGHGEGVERVRTYHAFGPYAALQDGERYDLVVVTEDASGNVSGEQRFPLAADLSAPAGLTVDGPGTRTADRSPVVSGAAVVGAGDDTAVWGDLCAGTSCEAPITRGSGGSSPVIGSFGAEISGGRWSTEVRRWDPDPDADPDALLDLPNGTYTVEVWFCDRVSNCMSRTRTFEVTDPEPVIEQPRDDQQPSESSKPSPAPAPPVVQRPADPPAIAVPSARVVAEQLSRAAADGLAAARLKGLLRGASLVLRPARPGSVRVHVLDAAKKRVLARGVGAGTLKVRPTAAGRGRLRRARKLQVVVRTSFAPAGGPAVRVDRKVTLKR